MINKIIEGLKNAKGFINQLVAIKNSKSNGQLAPGLNAVMVNGSFEGFLWGVEEITYNRYGGSNSWNIVYSAMSFNYSFVEEDSKIINNLYMGDNEIPITITFGRRNGKDYKYVLIDNWERPTKFKLYQIPEKYVPIIYSLSPNLINHEWNGETVYRDIFVPKQVLYPYAGDNELVLCCSYDPSLGYLTAYWDGECVRWKSTKQEIHLDWCFLPKSKEELLNKINSKKEESVETVEEDTEDFSEEEKPRRRRRRN